MDWNHKEARWHGNKRPRIEPVKFSIGGQDYDRVRYGEGEDDLAFPKCDDCGVKRGAIHQIGCDLEPCPRCGGQAITCDCFYDDDREENAQQTDRTELRDCVSFGFWASWAQSR